MKKNKILLLISNLDDIKKYEEEGITNFLMPLFDYSVGYTAFSLSEIKKIKNPYILVNRLLTDDDIDKFLEEDYTGIRGFVIEDIGLMYELTNKGFELICYQNHLNNSTDSVNFWLKFFDSIVISTDLDREETINIVNNSNKKIVLYTFGKPMIMYSRRKLITNYSLYHNLNNKEELKITDKVTKTPLYLKESKYGTVCFYDVLCDYRSIISDDNIKYYLIDTSFSSFHEILDVINGKQGNYETGFLDKTLVYRIEDLK